MVLAISVTSNTVTLICLYYFSKNRINALLKPNLEEVKNVMYLLKMNDMAAFAKDVGED